MQKCYQLHRAEHFEDDFESAQGEIKINLWKVKMNLLRNYCRLPRSSLADNSCRKYTMLRIMLVFSCFCLEGQITSGGKPHLVLGPSQGQGCQGKQTQIWGNFSPCLFVACKITPFYWIPIQSNMRFRYFLYLDIRYITWLIS